MRVSVVLALVLAGACGLFAPRAAQSPQPDQAGELGGYVGVLRATRPLPRGTVVDTNDVRVVWVEPQYVSDTNVRFGRLPKWITTHDILDRELLRTERLREVEGPAGRLVFDGKARGEPDGAEQRVVVLVATRELPAGHVLEETDVFEIEMTPGTFEAFGCAGGFRCYGERDAVVGRTLATPVFTNDVVRAERLADGSAPRP